MVKRIAKYLLKRKVSKQNRTVKAFNLAEINSALIVYNASSEEHRNKVIQLARFFKEERIKTETLGFYKKKNKNDQPPQDEAGYFYFDKEEINWLGFPTSTQVNELINKGHNLLIDLNLENLFCLEVITSLSNANFKVGKSQAYQKEVCDMTIDTKDKNLDFLIDQIKNYLKKINR